MCLLHVLGDKLAEEERSRLNGTKTSDAVDTKDSKDQAMATGTEVEWVIGVG
jgi:hypothetical protein